MSIVFKSFDFFLNKNHPNKISSNAKFQTEVLEVHRLFPHSLKTSKSISFVVSEQKLRTGGAVALRQILHTETTEYFQGGFHFLKNLPDFVIFFRNI